MNESEQTFRNDVTQLDVVLCKDHISNVTIEPLERDVAHIASFKMLNREKGIL